MGGFIYVEVTNGKLVQAMSKFKNQEDKALEHNVMFSNVILDTIKSNASGRPGPNVDTGRYRKKMKVEQVTPYSMSFSNRSPQGHRLEYGFTGVDTLGRQYHQPAFPHFRPAINFWKKSWARSLAKVYMRGLFEP